MNLSDYINALWELGTNPGIKNFDHKKSVKVVRFKKQRK